MSLTQSLKIKKNSGINKHYIPITVSAYSSLASIAAWFKAAYGFKPNSDQIMKFALRLHPKINYEELQVSARLVKFKSINALSGRIGVSTLTFRLFKNLQKSVIGTQAHKDYIATALIMGAQSNLPEVAKWNSSLNSRLPRRIYPVPSRLKTVCPFISTMATKDSRDD